MEIIERPLYLNLIISLLNRGMMLILVGQRRVGKSCLLKQLEAYLKNNRHKANIAYINKELHAFKNITHADELYQYAAAQLPEGEENYLLIDEVQDIEGYENALRSLHAEGRCQIVATGSNAYIFSSELSTRLAGRYMEIPIYSLTYSEFLKFHGLSDDDRSLETYLRIGGLPGLRQYDIENESQTREYLQSVYDTIMLRDVIARGNIRNITFIENLSAFVADNVGKLLSVRNITNVMAAQGEKLSSPLAGTYLRFLCAALIITAVRRFDIHGKRLLEQIQKYYFSDHGLRNLLSGFNLRGSIEKIIENVIFNHLRAWGYQVSVGTLRNGEIDFVATRNDERIYLQASYLLSSEETIRREFGNLKNINDNFPKYVVTMEPVSGDLPDYPGIRHVRLRDFLVSQM